MGGGWGASEQACRRSRKNGNLASIPPHGAQGKGWGEAVGESERLLLHSPWGCAFKGAGGQGGQGGQALMLLRERAGAALGAGSSGECLDLLGNAAGRGGRQCQSLCHPPYMAETYSRPPNNVLLFNLIFLYH